MGFDTYIHGVDISRYQTGPNDFGVLRRAGYDFAIQRWGVGTYRDPTRVANIAAIAAAGLIPGAYLVPGEHTGSGAEQAARFVTEVRAAFPTLPLLWVLDAEHSTAYGDPTAQQCADFCAEIRRRTGRVTLAYIPKWWMDGQGWTRDKVAAVAANALWWQSRYKSVPAFASPTDAGGYAGWPLRLWQWTSTGPAPGIPGNCDKDVFYGTRAELAAWAGASTPTPTTPEEADMQPPWIVHPVESSSYFLWRDDVLIYLATTEDINAAQAAGAKHWSISSAQWAVLTSQYEVVGD